MRFIEIKIVTIISVVLAALNCRLSTPHSFVDDIPQRQITMSGVSFRDGGELYSGFISGTLTSQVESVEYAFDSDAYTALPLAAANSTGGYPWRIAIPTGASAAASKSRWQLGSKHTLKFRARYSAPNGNRRSDSSVTYAVTFTQQINRDINGDGYADIIVGSNANQGVGANDKGAAYIYYGSANGITRHPLSASAYSCDGPPDCTVLQNPMEEVSGGFGQKSAVIGDVNGDGYAEVAVSSRNQGTGMTDKGAAYIFYGSSSGIASRPLSTSTYTCNGPPDCTVIQNPENETSGFFPSVLATAGDVNGDGYTDLLASSIFNQGTGVSDKGAGYIFYGSATGLISRPLNSTPYVCNGPPNCTVMQNPENKSGAAFGATGSGIGDANGDGYGDVVLAGSGNDAGGSATSKGATYVFYGSATGTTVHTLSASTYACNGPPDCTVMQNPDDEATSFFGASSYAGDANGDGFMDIVVGSYNNQGVGASNKGVAYVFYGSANGMTLHPLSPTPYICNGPPDCTTFQNPLDEANAQFGQYLSFAGDVNGDSYSDVLIGGYQNNGAGVIDKGAVYVFYGSATGMTPHATSAASYACSGPPDCSVAQNPDDESSGRFGASVVAAGDVNGDGYADIAAGAYNNQGGGASNKGASYVFYGSASGITTHQLNATSYNCNGPPDCSVIQNPEDEASGVFGIGIGYLAPASQDGYLVDGESNTPGGGTVNLLHFDHQFAILRKRESATG